MEYSSPVFRVPHGFLDHLYIELTDRCNLKCKHCYLSAGPQKKHTLDPEMVKAALVDFQAMGGHTVAFSGGEPFLHTDLELIVEYAAKLNLYCTIVTNCTMLDRGKLERILELGTVLAVSLEGYSEGTHDAIRGKGNFAKVQEVLKILEDRSCQDRVIICFTPMKSNFNEFPSLVNSLYQRGFARYYVSLLEERGRQKANAATLSLTNSDKVQLLTSLVILLSNPLSATQIDTGHLAPFFYRLLDQALWDGKEDPVEGTLRMSATGDVYLSAYAEGDRFRLGNLYDNSLYQCATSSTFYNLLADLENRSEHMEKCRRCPYMIICCGGSVARAYTKYQDFHQPDDFCEARQIFLDHWFQV